MAKRFGVSEMTIRRDFHGMEEQGLVTIHYGGASLRNTHSGFPSFSARQEKLYQNKLKLQNLICWQIIQNLGKRIWSDIMKWKITSLFWQTVNWKRNTKRFLQTWRTYSDLRIKHPSYYFELIKNLYYLFIIILKINRINRF